MNTIQKALDISNKAAAVGFDWPSPMAVLDKVVEELAEIRQALYKGESKDRVAEEVGDLFFALVNFNRKMQIDSEQAFLAGTEKFDRRYQKLCEVIEESGHHPADLDSDSLEAVWQTIKMEEKNAQ